VLTQKEVWCFYLFWCAGYVAKPGVSIANAWTLIRNTRGALWHFVICRLLQTQDGLMRDVPTITNCLRELEDGYLLPPASW